MDQPSPFTLHPALPLLAVIAGNITPIFGVLFYDWSLFDIFYLYWAENVLIGAFTAIRMLVCASNWGIGMLIGSTFNVGFVAFFAAHYSLFCFGHGMILFDLFYEGPVDIGKNENYLFTYALDNPQDGFYIAILGIVLVVITEGMKKIAQDRRDARLPMEIMISPYGRIVVLHLTIIFGGLAAQSLGAPIWALALLIVLKTGYDVLVVMDKKFIRFDTDKKEST